MILFILNKLIKNKKNMKEFSFYTKGDKKKEKISTIKSPSRLSAAKYFAKLKNLNLKEFLSIWKITR
tara:strand:+ start:405 stop:605 length:201 start_codon:yes stop_codon:yes gene_type:complete